MGPPLPPIAAPCAAPPSKDDHFSHLSLISPNHLPFLLSRKLYRSAHPSLARRLCSQVLALDLLHSSLESRIREGCMRQAMGFWDLLCDCINLYHSLPPWLPLFTGPKFLMEAILQQYSRFWLQQFTTVARLGIAATLLKA